MASPLPLPIARLWRRSTNAKSAKDRHDTAYFAFEVSVRLAVSVRSPQDIRPLMRGSVGDWVAALRGDDPSLDQRPLLDLFALLSEVGLGKKSMRRSIHAKELLAALPAYRNRAVGHGQLPSDRYEAAGQALLDALPLAWEAGIFLQGSGRLIYTESVALTDRGQSRARLLDMTGDAPLVIDPRGSEVPSSIRPHRLYWLENGEYTPLHPWLLFAEESERVYCFNGLGRRGEYLDYASGDVLKGASLEAASPGIEADLRALFSAPAPPSEEEEIAEDPNRFGDFEILGKLGQGAMGEVYLARQESLGRRVALKMLPTAMREDPVALARFRREVKSLSRCEHPHVVKILTSGEARGTPFYAMEYVEGADLSQVARALSDTGDFDSAVSTAWERTREERKDLFEDAPIVPQVAPRSSRGRGRYKELASFFRDAARGAHHLHEQGIVHRDLKPGNLMVTAAGHRAVVMDLGLAAVEDASLSLTLDKDQILGTLRYMPPEQLQRNLLSLDRRADVYALGATLYELLSDRPLFDGDTQARLIEQVLREEPAPLEKIAAAVPRDLSTIVRKATDKDPKLRYETAEALAQDLEAWLEGRPIAARPPTLGYLFRLTIRRHKETATAIAAALLVIVAGTLFFVLSLQAERDRVRSERDRADENAKTAEANEERAKAQELEARASAEEARLNEELARANLRDLLGLSSIEIVRALRRRADEDLWPAIPEKIPAMEAWIREAEAELLPLLPELSSKLEALEGEALSYTEKEKRRDRETHPELARLTELETKLAEKRKEHEGLSLGGAAALLAGRSSDPTKKAEAEAEVASLERQVSSLQAEVATRRTFEFEDDADQTAAQKRWRHSLLRSLVDDLRSFVEGPGEASEAVKGYAGEVYGASLPEVKARLDLARATARRTLEDERAKALWAEAIADIAVHPLYRGLQLTPQAGLLPIGKDPRSTLSEFLHVQTGEAPERDEEGRIVVSDDMGIVLVLIPGGSFDMGAVRPSPDRPEGPNVDPEARGDESPILRVELDAFFLSKYEMTQGQWLRARASAPSYYGEGASFTRDPAGTSRHLQHPVENVSFDDCREISARLDLTVPTEAQWEFGTRAGTATVYWCGDDESALEGAANVHDQRSFGNVGESWGRPVSWDDGYVVHAPVGRFAANGFGLHDVHGNLWEWCRDEDGGYEVDPRPGDGLRSHPGARLRVNRGGSFNLVASNARSALRNLTSPGVRSNDLGVRLARVRH